MTNLIPTATNSRFAEWTQDDLQQTAAAAADDTQDANVRLYAAGCIKDYLKEISGHLEAVQERGSL